MKLSAEAIARFLEKVEPEPNSGCHLWTGAWGGRYGVVGSPAGPIGAHRFAYYAFVGRIPRGLHVLHRCDNPTCVNPDHLFVGTHADNMADMRAKERARKSRQAKPGSEDGKFVATVTYTGGATYQLGAHRTAEAAEAAIQNRLRKIGGHHQGATIIAHGTEAALEAIRALGARVVVNGYDLTDYLIERGVELHQ